MRLRLGISEPEPVPIVADSAVEDEPGKRWVIGDVMLYLHGDSGHANLAKRVR